MGALKGKFTLRTRGGAHVSIAADHAVDGKCTICQETIGATTPEGIVETWAALPCGHRFGSYCIKTWLGLTEQPSCPICRREMAHSCGHPVLPTLPTKRRSPKGLALESTCHYCTRARWRNPRRGILGRVAVGAIKFLVTGHFRDRLDRMYWEVWRRNHSSEFGRWWAVQEPRTEPAVAPAGQGWAF